MGNWFKRDLISRKQTASLTRNRIPGQLVSLRRSKASPAQGVLVRMINDCIKLRATEVFIESSAPTTFKFVKGGESYRGTLPVETIESVRKLTAVRSPVSLDWDEVDVEELQLGISTDGASPVYCFSWKNKTLEPVPEETILEIQREEIETGLPLVLIVDDDSRFAQILSRILEEQGFQTLTALNGKQGLEVLEHFNPSLVISDVHMPHLSGPEFLLEIKNRGFRVPCLVLTNDEDALTEAEFVLLGASAFVRKSEDPRVLLAWCRRLTSLKRVA